VQSTTCDSGCYCVLHVCISHTPMHTLACGKLSRPRHLSLSCSPLNMYINISIYLDPYMYICVMRTYIEIHFETNLENDLWLFICIWLGKCINTLINRCRIILTHTHTYQNTYNLIKPDGTLVQFT